MRRYCLIWSISAYTCKLNKDKLGSNQTILSNAFVERRKTEVTLVIFSEMTQVVFPSLLFDVSLFVLVHVYASYYVSTLALCFSLYPIVFQPMQNEFHDDAPRKDLQSCLCERWLLPDVSIMLVQPPLCLNFQKHVVSILVNSTCQFKRRDTFYISVLQ